MTRKRIRDKAIQMADYLVLADLAGLFPYSKGREEIPNIPTLVAAVWNHRLIQSVMARLYPEETTQQSMAKVRYLAL